MNRNSWRKRGGGRGGTGLFKQVIFKKLRTACLSLSWTARFNGKTNVQTARSHWTDGFLVAVWVIFYCAHSKTNWKKKKITIFVKEKKKNNSPWEKKKCWTVCFTEGFNKLLTNWSTNGRQCHVIAWPVYCHGYPWRPFFLFLRPSISVTAVSLVEITSFLTADFR